MVQASRFLYTLTANEGSLAAFIFYIMKNFFEFSRRFLIAAFLCLSIVSCGEEDYDEPNYTDDYYGDNSGGNYGDGDNEQFVSVSSDNVSVIASGATVRVYIDASGRWEIINYPSWIRPSITASSNSGYVDLYIDANPNASSRNATLIIRLQNNTQNVQSAYISVTQDGYNGNGNDDNDNPQDSVKKPSAPTGVSVSNEGNNYLPYVVIRWNEVSNATKYNVYRSSSASSGYSKIGTTEYNSYTDEYAPTDGKSAYYKVTAVNSAGESSHSSYAKYTSISNDEAFAPVYSYGNCTVSGNTMTLRWTYKTGHGYGKATSAVLRVWNPYAEEWQDTELSASATSASFNFSTKIDSDGYVKSRNSC